MQRLQGILDSWLGTRYMAGASRRGSATDCVRFVVGVLDELYRISGPAVHRRPPNLSLGSSRKAYETVRMLRHRYPSRVLRGNVSLEPGDAVVTRVGKGPGHVLLVGPRPNTLWHAIQGSGVCETGLGSLCNVQRVYQFQEKYRWA